MLNRFTFEYLVNVTLVLQTIFLLLHKAFIYCCHSTFVFFCNLINILCQVHIALCHIGLTVYTENIKSDNYLI